jgi:hypothetical protein
MKKIGFLAFLVLLFASCNKEENPIPETLTYDPNLLLKGWSYDTILWNGTLYLYDHNPDCNRDFFGFRNNKGQEYQFEDTYFTNTYCSGNTTILRWEPIGNRVNFYFGIPKVDEFEVISLTDDLFTFAIDRDIDNDGKKEHLIISAIPYDPYNSFRIKVYKIKAKTPQKLNLFPVKLHLINIPVVQSREQI